MLGALTRGLGAVACAAVFVACSASSSSGGSGGGSAAGGTAGAGGTGTGGSGGSIALGGSSGTGPSDGGGGAAGACNQAIDIVFVMDVSTSMDQFLNKLANDIDAVDQAVKQLNLSVQPHYGLVVFVDDFTFANSSQPYADVATLKTDFKSWASFTSSNQQTYGGGFNSTWPENSLDALYAAASQFAWRPAAGTLRLVIHTTDDTFWQGPTTQDGVSIVHDYSGTVSALEQAQVRVFSFASKLGGPTETTDVSAGWFGPYAGQPAIPDATGGGVYLLDDVLSGSISLATAIPAAVKDSLCKPYPVPQ